MRFRTSKDWDYSTVLAVLKLDGQYATEGVDYRLYKDGSYEADSIETGVDLIEGIVLYQVPSVHFEPDTVWKAVVWGDKVFSNGPVAENELEMSGVKPFWESKNSCEGFTVKGRVKM